MDDEYNKELFDFNTMIDYAQLAVYILMNSGSNVNVKQIKSEIIMLHKKFGTKKVRRLNKIILKM